MSARNSQNINQQTEDRFCTEMEWNAFRYIANEMSSEESLAFEQQLADNQQAREAVARSVQIMEAVSTPSSTVAILETVPNQRQSRRKIAFCFVSAVTLSCLAVIAIVNQSQVVIAPEKTVAPAIANDTKPHTNEQITEQQIDFVMARWTDLATTVTASIEPETADPLTSQLEAASVDEQIINDEPVEENRFAWIVTAVTDEPSNNSQDSNN